MATAAMPASAAEFTVTTTNDTFDGSCSNGCSLREAIELIPGGGTVRVPAGTYTLTRSGTGYDDSNSSGDIDIKNGKSVTVVGAGVGQTIIKGGPSTAVDGIFHIMGQLSISDVTLTNGNRPTAVSASEERDSGAGGAFRVGDTGGLAGALIASRVAIEKGQAFQGAGVFVSGTSPRSSASLEDSVITGNLASKYGGGISAFGDVSLRRTSVIVNAAQSDGGGIMLWNNPRATLYGENLTVGGNFSSTKGGGMTTGGTVTLDYSTFAGNQAKSGRSIFSDGGTLQVSNSILASSTDQNCDGPTVHEISSGGYNIDQGESCLPKDDNGTPGDPSDDFDQQDSDAKNVSDDQLRLQSLNVAQRVYTFGLGNGSFAIDRGNQFCFQPVDGRGVARPQGLRCDIGAHEQEQTDMAITMGDRPDPAIAGQVLTYEIGVSNISGTLGKDVVATTSTPDGTRFVGVTTTRGTCAGTISIRCELGDFAPGAGATVTVQVIPETAVDLTNRADVSSATVDVNRGDNRATASTTVQPAPAGPADPGPGAPTDPGPTPPVAEDPAVTAELRKSVKKNARKLKFRLGSNRDGSTLAFGLTTAKKGTIQTGKRTFTTAGERNVTIKLSKKARKALRKLKKNEVFALELALTLPSGETVRDELELRISTKKKIVEA